MRVAAPAVAGAASRQLVLPRVSRLATAVSWQPRLLAGRARSSRRPRQHAVNPRAMLSRYDPFASWPPYRTAGSSSGSTGSGSGSGMSSEERLAAAAPAQRQAMLSTAISSASTWQQLWGIVERYGQFLSANNVTHTLTQLERVVQGQQYLPEEAAQIEDLLDWLLQRSRELNATAQLGPQGLGATAGAVSRLQQAQRQHQHQQQQQQAAMRQQQQQQQQQAEAAAAEAADRQLRQQQAAEFERDQLMRELVDAAVAQKHRLSPQALHNLLSALADIEDSNMSADEIRQLLKIPDKSSKAAAAAAAAAPHPSKQVQANQRQQQQQQLGRQQQQQQQSQQQARPGNSSGNTTASSASSSSRSVSPDSLQATARQLGQLSPELAQEWYDRALRQGLEQGFIPRGVDQSYLSGFVAREIERAAARAADTSTNSSSSSRGGGGGGSGAVLLSDVVARFGQLMGVDHWALALHKLAELQQEGLAGSEQEVKAAAGSFFQQLQPLASSADGATLSSIVHSSKDLQLYSRTLIQACLARAKLLLEQQLRGAGDPAGAGFSGRRLGVLLHGLAVLGLKPTDDWLRLAVTAAATLLPTCSITDLERLASSLLILRINPGPTWTAAAEDRLEQLAAALGSSDSRRLRDPDAVVGDESSDEDEEGTGNARRAIMACVKALALLGGKRAGVWYQSILAAEQEEEEEQQQQQQAPGEDEEADVRQRRLREYAQQQAALAAAQQKAAAGGEQHVERELKKAVQQQSQQQHKAPKLHLHPHHHLQHRTLGASKQQQQQQPQQRPQGPPAASAGKQEVVPLASLDDYMDQELLQQQPQQQQQQQPQQQQQRRQERLSGLPHPHTSLSEPSPADASGATAGAGSSTAGAVEAAAPAAWAAEQSSRWAQTKGEAAQPSPATELQQRLDDSNKLFGSKRSSKQQQQQGKQKKSAKGAPAAPAGAGAGAGAASLKQQQAGASSGSRILPKLDPAAPSSRDIPVSFKDDSSSSKQPSSSDTAAPAPAPAVAASTAGPAKEAQPSKEAQRSAAEAADALAALMAEIEGQAVADSDQEEVRRDLGLTDEDSTEAQAQAAELQEAAELVQQATKQLDDLQAQQASKGQSAGPGAARGAAAGGQQQAGAGKGHRQQHKHEQRKQSSHSGKQQQQAGGSSRGDASSSTAVNKKKTGRALGSSGDAAFLAAAKALDGPKAPSRTLLLGCLEAIEQQQQQLRAQLAKQQVESAVAGAARRQQAAQDPAARKLAQLRADFDRARERAAQEKSSIRETAAADVLARLLPLLDSFEAAEAALNKQQQAAAAAGSEREYEEARRVYNALHAQLLSIIKSEGARVVGDDGALVGRPFDPQEMEAVMRQPAPAGVADGDVLSVLRKGYAVGNRLVRPALVVVAYED